MKTTISEQILVGCSGWNYSDTPDKGGWTGVFYPNKDTKRLRYYSQFFNTAEMDSIFYGKFYSQMTTEKNVIEEKQNPIFQTNNQSLSEGNKYETRS